MNFEMNRTRTNLSIGSGATKEFTIFGFCSVVLELAAVPSHTQSSVHLDHETVGGRDVQGGVRISVNPGVPYCDRVDLTMPPYNEDGAPSGT